MDANWDKQGPSTCGGTFLYHGNAIGWFCVKQKDSSVSSTESENKTFSPGFKEGMYNINLMQDDMKIQITPIPTREDNQGAIGMGQQQRSNNNTKHIPNHYHWVREHIQDFKHFELEYVETEEQTADIFTKALLRAPFEKHRNKLMNHNPPTVT